jgi:hypothetical protein
MAIVCSTVTSGSSASSTASTASVTTVTNQLYFATVFGAVGANPNLSTGNGVTWTQITTVFSTGSSDVGFWYGVCTAGATGTFTANLGTGGGFWLIDTCSGVDTSGTIVQSVKGTAASTSPITITLAAFGNASNGAYAVFPASFTLTQPTLSPKAGWTAVKTTTTVSSGSLAIASEYIASNDTSVQETWTGGSGVTLVGWAVEIKSLPTDANTPLSRTP